MEYKGSAAYNSVMVASEKALKYRIIYTKNAIDYNTKHNNFIGIKFFTEELALIKSKLKIKEA